VEAVRADEVVGFTDDGVDFGSFHRGLQLNGRGELTSPLLMPLSAPRSVRAE
jgi:hypothetical protein